MFSLSIIIPVFNVEKYIKKCIESIMSQNCSDEIRCECIIVDDCSQDNSIKITESLIEKYNGNTKFMIIKLDSNQGPSAARNVGVDLAKGDYILFMDSDDWLPEDTLNKFAKIQKKYTPVDMIIGNHYDIKKGHPFSQNFSKPTELGNVELRKLLLEYQDINCSPCNKLIRTELVKKCKFPIGIIFEDILWSFNLFRKVERAVLFPDVTYIYENNHPNSITNTERDLTKVSLHIHSVSYIYNSILEKPYEDMYSESILGYFSFFINALRLRKQSNINNDSNNTIIMTRKKLVTQVFKDGHWLLSAYIYALTYSPMSLIFNIAWLRHHYHIIDKCARAICGFFDVFTPTPKRLKMSK